MSELIVKPLGTVSPFCYKNKNCPGYLIKYGNQNILLDCGNGVTRLLDLNKDLDNLSIFISHLHPDHYGDLISLLQAIYVYRKFGLLKSNINLFVPDNDLELEYVTIEDKEGWPIDCPQYVPSCDFKLIKKYADAAGVKVTGYENGKFKLGNFNIETIIVPHQIRTYAFKIQTLDGTVVYSSDTGPSDRLKALAENSDLFICESSLLKGQYRETDTHLYAFEAAMMARDAQVKKLILTHFWPYIDKQKYVKEALEFFDNTEAAVEGKQIVLRRTNNG